jgi:hypothetical protein
MAFFFVGYQYAKQMLARFSPFFVLWLSNYKNIFLLSALNAGRGRNLIESKRD